MQWKDSDLDFTRNYFFIDEAGFHINMQLNYKRSAVGTCVCVKAEKIIINHLYLQSLALFSRIMSLLFSLETIFLK
ncbi:hypothetical protein CLU79DRAFT_800243 [Phycomyces nitens]|nr:hypothetical protein CLU79DRAFT_800243 [Phycomyces nitens]